MTIFGTSRGNPRKIVTPGRSVPMRGGGSAIATGVQPGPDTIKLDPFLFPPPFSIPINVGANVAITGVGGRFDAGVTFEIPDSNYGVISSIDLLLDSILITSNVLWTIFVNGMPVPGFAPLTILGRNGAASVSKSWPGPLRIVIPLGGQVSVQIVDVDGAPYTAGTQLYGWQLPQQR